MSKFFPSGGPNEWAAPSPTTTKEKQADYVDGLCATLDRLKGRASFPAKKKQPPPGKNVPKDQSPGILEKMVQKKFKLLNSPQVVKEFTVTDEKSFSELEQSQELAKQADHFRALTGAYQAMTGNIMNDPAVTDKVAALMTLNTELKARLGQAEKNRTKDVKPTRGYLRTSEGETITYQKR